MKTMARCLFVLVMLIVATAPVHAAAPPQSAAPVNAAAPAQSAPPDLSYDGLEVLHVFMCEMGEGVTEGQIDALAQQKLKALRQMPGAEKARVHILWPTAVSNMGTADFQIVWIFPSYADWGKFWDAYNDATPMARADDLIQEKVVCAESSLWEAHELVLPK